MMKAIIMVAALVSISNAQAVEKSKDITIKNTQGTSEMQIHDRTLTRTNTDGNEIVFSLVTKYDVGRNFKFKVTIDGCAAGFGNIKLEDVKTGASGTNVWVLEGNAMSDGVANAMCGMAKKKPLLNKVQEVVG
jgi:hypothetical protein